MVSSCAACVPSVEPFSEPLRGGWSWGEGDVSFPSFCQQAITIVFAMLAFLISSPEAAAYSSTESTACQVGWGGGTRVGPWDRRAATRYTHCRTAKGNLKGWLRKIGKEEEEECGWCGGGV